MIGSEAGSVSDCQSVPERLTEAKFSTPLGSLWTLAAGMGFGVCLLETVGSSLFLEMVGSSLFTDTSLPLALPSSGRVRGNGLWCPSPH